MEISKEQLFDLLENNGYGRRFTTFVDHRKLFTSDHVYLGQEKPGKFLIAPRADGIAEKLKIIFKGYKNVKIYPKKMSDTMNCNDGDN